jgi:hypothetical protein
MKDLPEHERFFCSIGEYRAAASTDKVELG